MQLKEIRLSNAFQHSALTVPLAPFTSLVGANGSGKSNLLEAAALALTGVMTLPGKLESAIKEGEEKGKVELTILAEGNEYELVAHLGKSNRTLSCKARDLKITKSSEVLEYVEKQLLRTPFQIVNSSSIVRQGQLDAGLFDTAARRTDAFMRMAGLSDIEKKRQLLADAKAMVTVPMLSFSVSEAEKKVQELKNYLAKVWAEHEAIPATDKDTLESCRKLIATKKMVDAAIQELSQTKGTLSALEDADAEAKSLLTSRQQSLANQTDIVKGLEPAVDAAKLALAGHERAVRDWNEKLKAQADLDNTNTALGKLKPVDEEFKGENIEELSGILTEIRTKISGLADTIAAFKQPTICCPTCRRTCTVQEAEVILKTALGEQTELKQMEAETLAVLNKAKVARTEWEKARKAYVASHTVLIREIGAADARVKQLASAKQPGSVDSVKQVLRTYENAKGLLNEATRAVQEAVQLCHEVDVQLKATQVKLDELQKQAMTDIGGAPMGYEAAVKYVAEHETHQRKVAELQGIISATNKQLADETARLEKLRKQTEEAKTLGQYTEYLEFARTALHRDSFPSGKVKAFVDRMLVNANMYLDAMQAGFSVSYTNDDGFIAFFPGENKNMRADRLSGGEKVTFALAFRFAVNDLHTDTGFLILDEPTVWLDDKHIDYVINALSLVKTKLVPRVQLVIVTHDEKLAAVADSVFEVKKG